MSLEEAVRAELLAMRKHTDGVTVGALARTETIRRVLGGGDPRMAYNVLKHILIERYGDLPLKAAAYSLGYASDGRTHLDRLNDFGQEHGYDQRQARRYSDKGVLELARVIATEWTIEASPTLTIDIVHITAEIVVFAIIARSMDVIEMQTPRLEAVVTDTDRDVVDRSWDLTEADGELIRTTDVELPVQDSSATVLSVRWLGELWPRFVVCASNHEGLGIRNLEVQTLSSRIQVAVR